MDVEEYLKIKQANAKNSRAKDFLDARYGTNKGSWTKWVFDQLFFPPHAAVLELGCGPAALWAANLHRLPGDAAVMLTDFCQGTLNAAKRALGAKAGLFGFAVVNAEQIPYSDDLFDIVLANRMLYFIADRKRALFEMSRVLKPCGMLYAATIGRKNMAEISDLYFDCFQVQDRSRKTSAEFFGLENGADQLSAYFHTVQTRRFENALLVTESWPLIEYVLSARSFDNRHLTPGGIRIFKNYLDGIIRRQGHIRVTKEVGLFIAEK